MTEENGALMLLTDEQIETLITSLLSDRALSEEEIHSALNQASQYYTFGTMINLALAGKIDVWLDPTGKLAFKNLLKVKQEIP